MSNNIIMFFNSNSSQNIQNMNVDFNAEDSQIINCSVQLTSALNYNTFAPFDSVTCGIIDKPSVNNSTNLESNIRAATYLRVGTKINGTDNYIAVGPLFKINMRSKVGGGRWKIQGYSLIAHLNTVNVEAVYYNQENKNVSDVITSLFEPANFQNLTGCFCNVTCNQQVYGYIEANSCRNVYGQISLAYGLHTGYNKSCLTNGTLSLGPACTTSTASVGKNNIYVGNNTTELENAYSVNVVGYNYISEEMKLVCVYDQAVTSLSTWGDDNFYVNFTNSIEPSSACVTIGVIAYWDTSYAIQTTLRRTYSNSYPLTGLNELFWTGNYTGWGVNYSGNFYSLYLPAGITESDVLQNNNSSVKLELKDELAIKNSSVLLKVCTVTDSNTINAMVELLKNSPCIESNSCYSNNYNGLNSAWRSKFNNNKRNMTMYFDRLYMCISMHFDRYLYYAGQGLLNINKYVVNGVNHNGFYLNSKCFPLPWVGTNEATSVHSGNLQISGKTLEYDSTLSCTYQSSGMPTVFYSVKDIRIITSESNSTAAMCCVCSRIVNYAKASAIEKFSYLWDGNSSPGNQMSFNDGSKTTTGLITETTVVLSSFPKATSTVRIGYNGV